MKAARVLRKLLSRGGGKAALLCLIVVVGAVLVIRVYARVRAAQRRAALARANPAQGGGRRAAQAAPQPAADAPGRRGSRRRRLDGRCTVVSIARVAVAEDGRSVASPAAIAALRRAAARVEAPLCVVFQTPDGAGDEAAAAAERAVERLLDAEGVFSAGLKRHRLLFCRTAQGRAAMVRHLEPAAVIDDDPEVVRSLAPFVPRVSFFSAANGAAPVDAANVGVVDSLAAALLAN